MQIEGLSIKLIRENETEGKSLNFAKVFSILEIKDNDKRRLSYLMSRLALKRALSEYSVHIPLDNLFLIKNSNIYGVDGITASISHTKDAAVAAVSKKYCAIGIDIELKDRVVKNGAESYYINNSDLMENMTSLEKWTVKEACYKAFSNYLKEDFLLKDIVCSENKAIYKDTQCLFRFEYLGSHLIAVAFVIN